MPPRVLTVARWYPSHDSPGRGSFVADLVAATGKAGAEHVVASFETVRATPHLAGLEGRRAAGVAAYAASAEPAALLSPPRSWAVPGVPVARLPVVPVPGGRDADATITAHHDALAPFAGRLLSRWRPDVIHAHTGLPDGAVAAALGRRHDIPVVVSEHASTVDETLADDRARERYLELLAPGVRLVAVSPSLRARLAAALGRSVDAIGILPNPVAVEGFTVGPGERIPDQLLWVGSRAEHKGMDPLLRAVALVRERRPGVHLRLIGRPRLPADDDRWRALATELGIGDAVTFEPWASREAVAAAMRRAAVFVHPSPTETFGVVAAEAIASGLPVAARRSGGVPWIVDTSGGFGAIAAGDDAPALAAAIHQLLGTPPAIGARAARDRIVAAFGPEAVARSALELYPRGVAPDRPEAADLPAAVPLPTVVVGIERAPTLRAVGALPPGLRSELTVLTAAGVPDAPDLGVGALVEVDLDAAHRASLAAFDAANPPAGILGRLADRLRGRRRAAERAALLARRPAERQAALATALRQHLAARAGDGAPVQRPPVPVVALDLGGIAAILDAPGAASLAPAALRWLVDRWDEGRRPTADD